MGVERIVGQKTLREYPAPPGCLAETDVFAQSSVFSHVPVASPQGFDFAKARFIVSEAFSHLVEKARTRRTSGVSRPFWQAMVCTLTIAVADLLGASSRD